MFYFVKFAYDIRDNVQIARRQLRDLCFEIEFWNKIFFISGRGGRRNEGETGWPLFIWKTVVKASVLI